MRATSGMSGRQFHGRHRAVMPAVAVPMSWRHRAAVTGGLLVSLLLVTQVFYSLDSSSDQIGTSVGLFFLGLAVLVVVGGIFLDRSRSARD